MEELEDFVIEEPYQPTEEELRAIAQLESKGVAAKNWDSKRNWIKSFKDNLREDMYEKQNGLCAFCRIHVPLACVPMHREHIVYKDAHPQWMFLPENLCIACPVCNGFKGTTEVLSNPQTKTYPKTGDGFRIIHPLFDRYSENIELVGGVLYRGKTAKGKFTIATCHLYRVKLAEERVTHIMIEEHKGNALAGILMLLSQPEQSEQYVDDQQEFLRYVEKIVKEYKEKMMPLL